MSTIILNCKIFPSDLFSEVLDHVWTGREDESEKWGSLFAPLCLPRIFGTIWIWKCKTIGLLWRAVQLNPSLGSHIHTFRVRFETKVWPEHLIPSEAMERMFTERTMETLEREVESRNPGAWKDSKREFWRNRFKGPDGHGYDTNIKNPQDLKLALVEIFQSFTKLRKLHWGTESLPLFSSIIKHLEQLDSLQVLTINPAACEEDYFLPSPPEGKLNPPTPLWLLSKHLEQLTVMPLGPGLRDCSGVLDEDFAADDHLLQRQIQASVKCVNLASDLDFLDLFRVGGFEGARDVLADFIPATLPRLACISSIVITREGLDSLSPSWEIWGPPIKALHPNLAALWNRKGSFKAEVIQALGKAAGEEVDHPLSKLAEHLKKSEVAEEMAENWNRKYSS